MRDHSVGADRSLFALIASGANLQLIRSVDDGATWANVETPAGVFGAEFGDAETGFAWGSELVHATSDGGRTWREVSAPSLTRSMAGRPVVDVSGSLWIAKTAAPGPPTNLLKLGRDLKRGNEIVSKDSVSQLVASEVGVWLVRQKGGFGTAYLAVIANGAAEPVAVADLSDDLPIDLSARATRLAVLFSKVDPIMFTSRKSFLLSEDGGGTWRRTVFDRDNLRQICVGPTRRVWAVGAALWRNAE